MLFILTFRIDLPKISHKYIYFGYMFLFLSFIIHNHFKSFICANEIYVCNLACLHAQKYHYFRIFFFPIKSVDIESSIGKRFTQARYPSELITFDSKEKIFWGKKIKKKKRKKETIKIGKNYCGRSCNRCNLMDKNFTECRILLS